VVWRRDGARVADGHEWCPSGVGGNVAEHRVAMASMELKKLMFSLCAGEMRAIWR